MRQWRRLCRSVSVLLASLLACVPAAAARIDVADTQALTAAIRTASPGDDIVLADGVYAIAHKIVAAASGTIDAPITVRAAHPYGARIRSSGLIAFEITGADWSFANLDIRGNCTDDTRCEHAFHVVGASDRFRLSDSRLADFNAHIKVNADPAHHLPQAGLIESSEFFDTHPRHTDNPVAPINIDNALGWIVRGNAVHDFPKDGSGEGSYGIFVKGGSRRPIIERNIVTCARDLPPAAGMVGLSFGAHGMDPALCPPHWSASIPCDPEVDGGIMRNNQVLDCSDDGILLNRSADSHILFNTVLRTAGIVFRYPGSRGEARGNLIDHPISSRDGGSFHDGGNMTQESYARAMLVEDSACRRHDSAAFAAAQHALTLPGPDPLVRDDGGGRQRGARLSFGVVQTPSQELDGTCRPPQTPRR